MSHDKLLGQGLRFSSPLARRRHKLSFSRTFVGSTLASLKLVPERSATIHISLQLSAFGLSSNVARRLRQHSALHVPTSIFSCRPLFHKMRPFVSPVGILDSPSCRHDDSVTGRGLGGFAHASFAPSVARQHRRPEVSPGKGKDCRWAENTLRESSHGCQYPVVARLIRS